MDKRYKITIACVDGSVKSHEGNSLEAALAFLEKNDREGASADLRISETIEGRENIYRWVRENTPYAGC